MENESSHPTEKTQLDDSSFLTDDIFYRALAARPRRRCLWYLLEQRESTISELADMLCGWEAESSRVVSSERHQDTRVQLRHVHVPLLAEAGLVTFEDKDEEITLAELDEQAAAVIRNSVLADRD